MIFTIVTEHILNDHLPNVIIEKLGYSGNPTLKEKVLIYRELEDGSFAISVNLKAEGKQCAWTDLCNEEIELSKLMYGEENLLTKEQFLDLDFKEVFDE